MSALGLFKKQSEPSVRDLSLRLDQIESQIRLLRNEWAETYDKVNHALDRIGKRWQRLQPYISPDAQNDGKTPQKSDGPEDLYALARSQGLLK